MVNKNLVKELKQAPGFFVGTILLALVGTFATVLEYWSLASLINGIIFTHADEQTLWANLLWTLVGLGLKVLARAMSDYFGLRLSEKVQGELRRALLAKVRRANPLETQSVSIGKLMSTYLEGVDSLAVYFHSYLPQLVKSCAIPVCFLIFILPRDWISGLILMVTLPLIPFFMILIGKWTQSMTRLQWDKLLTLAAYLQDILRGLATLKVLGRSRQQGQRIAQVSENYRITTLRVQRWAFLSALVLELAATLSIAVVAVGLGLRLVNGELTYLPALFILLLAPEYYQPMRELGGFFHAGLDADEAAKDIYAFLARPDMMPAEAQLSTAFESLEFKNVSYTYPGADQPAVRNIQFSWHAGEKLALVGASGSGKTTLMHLALGFLRPTEGVILRNGRPLSEKGGNWGPSIGFVPQDPHVFRETIGENIAMCQAADEEKVRQAADRAGLSTLIADFPEGLNTPVGQGVHTLSGGQTALLALARVFYRSPEAIFLDEPTDHLDLKSEKKVLAALETLLADRSAFIIAHRLHTIRDADKVLVMSHGGIIEQGNYRTLMQEKGAFYALVGGERHA